MAGCLVTEWIGGVSRQKTQCLAAENRRDLVAFNVRGGARYEMMGTVLLTERPI